MGFTAKAKNDSSSSSGSSRTEGWGMGFFLVFFPEEEDPNNNINHITKKKTIFSSSSSSPISFNSLLKRTNSAHLLTKAQSTISICALLVFFSLLLFTLSTFEPKSNPMTNTPRRQLSSIRLNTPNSIYSPKKFQISHALQGMGTLYRRGTKAMNDLIICHVVESVTVNELRLFLRLLQRSSLGSRSDLLFIFSSGSSISFDSAIRQENESFLKLVARFKEFNGTAGVNSAVSFDVTQFVKSSKKERESAEPIWGRRIRSNSSVENGTELTRLNYGSVVGFEVDELDPENSLAGFLEPVPMNLRRWACYTMLLGRIRRNFKHVMLVDVKDVLLLGDPLGRVRNRSPESVYLSTVTSPLGKHGRKNSDKTQSPPHQKPVTPSIIMGGARGVRRLSNAMLTEIVRTSMQQHKRKNSVSESGLLSQLAENDFILKNIKLIISTGSIPDVSSVNSIASLSLSNYTVVRRGFSNIDFHAALMRHICSFPLDSSVYSDC